MKIKKISKSVEKPKNKKSTEPNKKEVDAEKDKKLPPLIQTCFTNDNRKRMLELSKTNEFIKNLFLTKEEIRRKNKKIIIQTREIQSIDYKKPSEMVDFFNYRSLNVEAMKNDILTFNKIKKMTSYEKSLYYHKILDLNRSKLNGQKIKNFSQINQTTSSNEITLNDISTHSLIHKGSMTQSPKHNAMSMDVLPSKRLETEENNSSLIKTNENSSKKKKNGKYALIKKLKFKMNKKLDLVKSHKKKRILSEFETFQQSLKENLVNKVSNTEQKKEKEESESNEYFDSKDIIPTNYVNSSISQNYPEVEKQISQCFVLNDALGIRGYSIYGICEFANHPFSFNIVCFIKDVLIGLLSSHITYEFSTNHSDLKSVITALNKDDYRIINTIIHCVREEIYFYYHIEYPDIDKLLSCILVFVLGNKIMTVNFGNGKVFVLTKNGNSINSLEISTPALDGKEKVNYFKEIKNGTLIVIGSPNFWKLQSYTGLFKAFVQNESLEEILNKVFLYKKMCSNKKGTINEELIQYSLILIKLNLLKA